MTPYAMTSRGPTALDVVPANACAANPMAGVTTIWPGLPYVSVPNGPYVPDTPPSFPQLEPIPSVLPPFVFRLEPDQLKALAAEVATAMRAPDPEKETLRKRVADLEAQLDAVRKALR